MEIKVRAATVAWSGNVRVTWRCESPVPHSSQTAPECRERCQEHGRAASTQARGIVRVVCVCACVCVCAEQRMGKVSFLFALLRRRRFRQINVEPI
jgi:hypothetical protein